MDKKTLKILGIIMLCAGILLAVVCGIAKESNKPIKVTSSFGSGYMGGWSSQTIQMLDTMTALGGVAAVVGFIVTALNWNAGAEEKALEEERMRRKSGRGKVLVTEKSANGVVQMIHEMEDGAKVRLNYSGQEQFEPGDSGEIIWQGEQLISFKQR